MKLISNLKYQLNKTKSQYLIAKGFSNMLQSSLKYRFNSGFCKIPHYLKKDKGGEDALAIHDGMICVADGVGGWNESGVDPSKYSNELCENVMREFLKNGNTFYAQPKRIFSDAAFNTISKGSATFCMCTLDMQKEYLHTVNLGDSGYMILRGTGKSHDHPNQALNKVLENTNQEKPKSGLTILYKSEEQTHSFNFPFQVGTSGDDPSSAQTNLHEFKENDIIILATDGLWDNLYENHILQILKPFYEINEVIPDLSIVADIIGETCAKYASDRKYQSPFSKRSRGLYLGGKEDDITVIVSQIVKNVIHL